MAFRNKMVLVLYEKDKTCKALRRLIGCFVPEHGKAFTLDDISSSGLFSAKENDIFKSVFQDEAARIVGGGFEFTFDGSWKYTNCDITPKGVIYILNHRLLNDSCPFRSKVSPADRKLIELLLTLWYEYVQKDSDLQLTDEDLSLEVDQEAVSYIAGQLAERLGEIALLDASFVRQVLDAHQEYDQLMLEEDLKQLA